MDAANIGRFSNFALSPFPHELAWHYTPHWNLEGIIQAGRILPARYTPAQRRVIYFTINAARPIDHQNANGKWLRFGYEGTDLFPIARLRTLIRANPIIPCVEEAFLEPHGRRLFNETKDWLVSFRPIAVDEFSIIQATDNDGETWRDVWINPKRAAGLPPYH